MTIKVECNSTETISYGDFIECLRSSGFDSSNPQSFVSVAPLLKRLYNNREFLSERIALELKDNCDNQSKTNAYSSQVIMLHSDEKDNFLIRANFWPSPKDSIYKSSGDAAFLYHRAHNHNFNFLTVGYHGTGYWSDYYHLDYEQVIGYPGEKVDLKFIETSQLKQGELLFFEAHKDTHSQLPPDEMSVTINILESNSKINYLDQYSFDVETSTITTETLSHIALEALLEFAAVLGGEEARDIIDYIADGHPSHRIRTNAAKSLLRNCNSKREREMETERLLAKSDNNNLMRNTLEDYNDKANATLAWKKEYEKNIKPEL